MNKSLERLSQVLLACLCVLLVVAPVHSQTAATTAASLTPDPKPADAPLEWKHLVGIYNDNKTSTIILERDGELIWKLPVKTAWNKTGRLEWSIYINPNGDLDAQTREMMVSLLFVPAHDSQGNVTQIASGQLILKRTDAGADPAHFFHVTPTKPVDGLRAAALAAKPPEEAGPFRKPELVELITLDSAFHLDIRYAQSNNFLSTPLYTQARAFMQRPAAEALLRVLHKLQPLGYGLLIHDAYRPWYVTKLFWDATPPEEHSFVADPQKGSKHNRGCAADLALYDLATGEVIEMPGLYDEMSPRSYPTFPGGTALQRWHRDLLRRAMESEGFTVDQNEWWHFDYKDWKLYPILNVPFEKLDKLPN